MQLASLRAPSSLEVCGTTIELNYAGNGLYVYRRRGPRRGEERRVLLGSNEATLSPFPPVYYPEHVTDHIMVKLPEPLAVKAGETIRLSLNVEYDVAVTVGEQVIDVFPSRNKVKYAVYGSPPRGVLVRYVKALSSEESSVCSVCCAELSLEIENTAGEGVTVHRIVLPAAPVDLQFEGSIVRYPPVKVTIVSPSSAIVVVAWQRRGRGPGSKSFIMGYGL